MSLRLLIPICLLALAACSGKSAAPAPFTVPDGMAPELNIGGDGRAYLSWLEKQGAGHALRFSVYAASGWTPPRTVASGDDWFVNAADFPSLTAFDDGVLIAHWLHRTGPDKYAYEIRMSLSHDGGATWDAPFTLHDDNVAAEHGFVTLRPTGPGRMDVVWLDGRNMSAGHDEDHEAEGSMTLRHAVIDDQGTVLLQGEVDNRSCDCCQTSAAVSSGGLIMAYRDRSEAEIRDVVVRRYSNSAWSDPLTLDQEHWKIEGCPVNGPSIVARASVVAAAWFSGAADTPSVLAAFSRDSGQSFTAPVRVDDGRPLGHVDLVLLDNGGAVVSWLSLEGDSAVLKLRRVDADGRLGMIEMLADLGPKAANGFPRMVRSGKDIIVAWTGRAADNTSVHTAVLAANRF